MSSVIVVIRTHIGMVLSSFFVSTLTTITEVGGRLVLVRADSMGRTPSVSGAFTTSELVGKTRAGDGMVGGMLTLVLGISEDLGRARLGGAEELLGTSEDLGRARLGGALLLLLEIVRLELELVLGMTSATLMLELVLGLISMLMPVAEATLLDVNRVLVSHGQLWMVVTMVEVTVTFGGRGLKVRGESSAMVSASPALTPPPPFWLTLNKSSTARSPNDFVIILWVYVV